MAGFDNEFWGSYTEQDGGDFVTEYEMLGYIAKGETLLLTGVRTYEGGQYGPQWQVDFTDAAGEEKTKSFKKGIVERDARIQRVLDTLEATGEPIAARFIKIGRRHDITGA